jgi:hypothetical protein
LHRKLQHTRAIFGIREKKPMLYHFYELSHAALSPARAAADACRLLFRNPLDPAAHTPLGRGAAAAAELPFGDIDLVIRQKVVHRSPEQSREMTCHGRNDQELGVALAVAWGHVALEIAEKRLAMRVRGRTTTSRPPQPSRG